MSSHRICFYIGLDTLPYQEQDKVVNEAVQALSLVFGGCSALECVGGWNDSGVFTLERAIKLEVITDKGYDHSLLAQYAKRLAEWFKNVAVLYTEESLFSQLIYAEENI